MKEELLLLLLQQENKFEKLGSYHKTKIYVVWTVLAKLRRYKATQTYTKQSKFALFWREMHYKTLKEANILQKPENKSK